LTEGIHTFLILATDSAGNIDPTPATVTWTSGCNAQIVGGSCFTSIASAIAYAPDGATIQAKAMAFAEEVQSSYPRNLTLSGGFGINFEPPEPGAMTTVNSLIINDGSMIVDNLAIQ
jgi:hypothetical protein